MGSMRSFFVLICVTINKWLIQKKIGILAKANS
jgi:hypothetical protein